MPKSIASLSHCFADWSFIVEWSYNIVHVCKGLWKLPKCPIVVNDPNVQELDHSRARVNDLQKAQEEQPEEITRISKELESFESVGIPLAMVHYLLLLWEHERTALIFPIPTQTHASQSRLNQFLRGWPAVFLYFVMVMFRFTFAGAGRIQRSCPNTCSRRKIQGRGVPAR